MGPHQNARMPSSRPSLRSVPRRHRHAGFTLIEVMVALIVLVLGVLGSAAMTLTAIRDGKQSGLRSQASALAYELGDLMRTTRSTSSLPLDQAAREAIFTSAAPPAVVSCWSANGCTLAEMAQNDYYEWHRKLTGPNGLPNGQAVICRDATKLGDASLACDGAPTSPLVVKLRWDEKNNNARDAAAPTSITVRTMAVPIQPY